MRKILLEISDELADAIDHARDDRKRNPAIEDWLWRIKEIKEAAKSLEIKKPERRKPGRPIEYERDESGNSIM